MNKLIRITTVPLSLEKLLEGQLRFMQRYFEVIAVSSDGEHLEKVGVKEGVRTSILRLTRQITPLKDLIAVIQFFRFLRKEKPLIVHSHTPKAGIIGMLAAKLAGVPVRLHTVAGLPLMETKGIKRQVLNGVEKLTYACATRVYPNSKGLYDFIVEQRFADPAKLKVLANGSSNGIDTTYFDPKIFTEEHRKQYKQLYQLPVDSFTFVFVGRLVKDKGLNELVNVFVRIQRAYPHARLLLVGGYERDLDPVLPEMEKMIEEHTAIIQVGFQQDVRPFLAIAQTLVFPSYREGFPNVVMQAGAMGLPAIVTDINGCNEIVIEGENGTIIPPKNEPALYTAMENMMVNPSYRDGLAEHARRMIVDRYEQRLVWETLLSEYKHWEQQYV